MKDLGEPREASHSLLRNNRAFGSLACELTRYHPLGVFGFTICKKPMNHETHERRQPIDRSFWVILLEDFANPKEAVSISNDMKICVLGLDCAAPKVVFGDDRLANLRRLMKSGVYGRFM